jgi:UDP:flavonoid glycosyltransferase YjiC (YdhE family)
MSKRIVITTYGSLGDLYPYLAIALELKARGHQAAIATSEYYRSTIEAEGIEFYPVQPDLLPDIEENQAIFRRILDVKHGSEYVVRQMLLPHLRKSYDGLKAAISNADLLLTHPLVFAGPLVAETTGIPWVSSVLGPLAFLSAYDPPVLAPFPSWRYLRPLGPWVNGRLFSLGKQLTRSWSEPVGQFRNELGLEPGLDHLFEGQHSPTLILALFSQLFAASQPDWPPQTCVTGFMFCDCLGGTDLSPELSSFLDDGPAPIVFTLGSSAIFDAGNFYTESARAAEQLGYRAVLLVGQRNRHLFSEWQSNRIAVVDYAPHAELFPRAAAIVHQGGIGTTAQALRSGRPMLVVPFSFDQPDNAARVTRLGVARTLPRHRYTANRVVAELDRLLHDPRYTTRATEVGHQLQAENGVKMACDAMDAHLQDKRSFFKNLKPIT